MIHLRRARSHPFAILAMAAMAGAIPVHASKPEENLFTRQELQVLDEYRLHCRPGRFGEEVKAGLDSMQRRYPGSTLLGDSAFLAEVHYLDHRGYLRDGNGRKSPAGAYNVTFDSLFNGYAPSREAWGKSRKETLKSSGHQILGVFLLAGNVFLGLHSLSNKVPSGESRPKAYRLAQLALPAGWIGSFVYAGACSRRGERELDRAFFESNGKAIAKRLGSR